MGNIPSNSNGEVVISIRPHCEHCASVVIEAVSAFEGVKSDKVDNESNTITVTGDPEKIWELLRKEMKKEVKLISCPSKDKEAPAEVIEVRCLFSGCIVNEFKKIACDTKGLKGWSYDEPKLTVKVEGKVNVKALARTLKERLNKHGQIVLAAAGNEENGGGGGSGGPAANVAEKRPEAAVVVYGNGIVAKHVQVYNINVIENPQVVFDDTGKSLKAKKGHKY